LVIILTIVICDTCRAVFTEDDIILQVKARDKTHFYIHETCEPLIDCDVIRRTNLRHVTARINKLTIAWNNAVTYTCLGCGKKNKSIVKNRQYCNECQEGRLIEPQEIHPEDYNTLVSKNDNHIIDWNKEY